MDTVYRQAGGKGTLGKRMRGMGIEGGVCVNLRGMERICSQCHAALAQDTEADWCPACGGALVEREGRISETPQAAPATVDHRGILLPRRHAVGGIITPQ